ncbi:repeat protein [Tupanvirus deep ocean]|uniref:Repeat protein n=2 Tax=Tupanvirus TaxID=2094720 RepID=A0AC62A7E2_9VIRU|nr:repeat protein [Tupanvirus deep ocean]QKU33567.1 repeat protein [Tupanvirus deep ocean]
MSVRFKIDLDYENIIDVINLLDQRNINIDFDQNKLFTNLIQEKMFDEISFFIDRGTDIKCFLELCSEEDKEVVTFLIENNADALENPGEFLVDLINTENFDSAKLMIDSHRGPLLDLVNFSSGKPLRTAVRKGNSEIISHLFLCGAKVKKCDIDPIIDALVFGKSDLIPLLLEHGSNLVNIMPEHLEMCLRKNYKLSVNYIYHKMIANQLPYFKNADLTSCFITAANSGNYDILKYFIENGNINIDDNIYFELKRHIKNTWVLHYLELARKVCHNKKSYKSKKYDSDDSQSDDESFVSIKKSKAGVKFKN